MECSLQREEATWVQGLKKQVYVTLPVKHYRIQAMSTQILSIFLGHLHLPQNCSHLSQPL